MLFHSQVFIFLFAPLAITLYWLLPKRLRLGWLALASYFFYGWWDWRFCFVMLLTTFVDFICGQKIGAATSARARKGWLALSLLVDLGLLGFFKYAAFTAGTVNALLEAAGGAPRLPLLEIVLPVGISFYTFQSLSYTIDVYNGRVKPTRSFIHYMAFVSLFPQLVAGPIVRYKQLGGQLLSLPERLTSRNLSLGLTFFAAGLVKKVLIADRLAYFTDQLWLDWRHLLPAEAWSAALGFSLQLYFDFAGYSLMAIGLGYLLGLSLPQNFNSPYRASDVADFWRRWHISLSTWLRDYLFLRIGGLTVRGRWPALVLTMLLTGLWHGAAWTFVLWGGYHGLLLLVHHGLRHFGIKWRGGWTGSFGTLLLVILGWVLFRAETLPSAMHVLKSMLSLGGLGLGGAVAPAFIAIIVLALLWAIFAPNLYELIHVRQAQPRTWALACLGVLAAVCVMLASESGPFLYYQF